jgi:hypothetical protein
MAQNNGNYWGNGILIKFDFAPWLQPGDLLKGMKFWL